MLDGFSAWPILTDAGPAATERRERIPLESSLPIEIAHDCLSVSNHPRDGGGSAQNLPLGLRPPVLVQDALDALGNGGFHRLTVRQCVTDPKHGVERLEWPFRMVNLESELLANEDQLLAGAVPALKVAPAGH